MLLAYSERLTVLIHTVSLLLFVFVRGCLRGTHVNSPLVVLSLSKVLALAGVMRPERKDNFHSGYVATIDGY
jgi:hypothetical protein